MTSNSAATALETLAAERDGAWAAARNLYGCPAELAEMHSRALAAETRADALAAENARLREAILTCDAELAEMGLQPEGRARLALRAALSPVRPVGESGRG